MCISLLESNSRVLLSSVIALLLQFIIQSELVSQQPTLEWARVYPENYNFQASATSLVTGKNGDVYVTGNADSGYCTIKYNNNGIRLWTVKFPGPLNIGYAKAIAIDSFSNVYVTGYVHNGGSIFDYCTIKYDSNGSQQWIRYYDGPSHLNDEGYRIGADYSGNIYVSGISSTSEYNFQYTTIKYSSDGNELWIRRLGDPNPVTNLNGLVIDNYCNIYITGVNSYHALTVRYDSSGNMIWTNIYPSGQIYAQANAICLDKDNNVFITGYFNAYSGSHIDFFTIKYSSTGVQIWARKYNPDSSSNSSVYTANALITDAIKNVYVNGSSRSSMWSGVNLSTIKYSENGDLLWDKKFEVDLNNQYNTFIDIDRFNNIYVGSSDFYIIQPNEYSSFLSLKYNSSGLLMWSQRYSVENKSGGALVLGMKLNTNNFIFITGYANSSMLTLKYSQPIAVRPLSEIIPNKFGLFQNYPNPFNPLTNIKFDLPKDVNAKIKVYDLLGREVAVLVNEFKQAGRYELEWNATNYASGVYIYRIEAGEYVNVKKMVLLK